MDEPAEPASTNGSEPSESSLLAWFRSTSGIVAIVAVVGFTVAATVEDLALLALPAGATLVVVIGRAAVAAARRDQRRVAEIRSLRDDAVRRTQAANDHVATLENRLRALEISTTERLAAAAEDAATQRAALGDRLGGRTDRVVEAVAALDETVAGHGTELAAVRADLVDERSRRSLVMARALDPGVPMRRILLQMTVHRSGSTRLLDRFRSHPAVRMAPSMEVWDALGLRGRRYPVAFSDTDDAALPLEIESGLGAAIPAAAPSGLGSVPIEDRWLVEKVHPQFTDFDAARLVERIAAVRADGVEVLVMYGVRRPRAAMWSMCEFKARQPSWYRHLTDRDVPDWIARSLECIAELHALEPGPIIDYDDPDDGPATGEVLRRLDPSWGAAEIAAWNEAIGAHFATSVRDQAPGTGFLGARSDRPADGPDGAWRELDDVIARAEASYAEILARRD